jgi:hypothetical protein
MANMGASENKNIFVLKMRGSRKARRHQSPMEEVLPKATGFSLRRRSKTDVAGKNEAASNPSWRVYNCKRPSVK